MSALVTLQGIGKNFSGIEVLKGVDFELYAGEVHALVGENGAGKSTLMRILAGEIAPTSGKMILHGGEKQHAGHAPRDFSKKGVHGIAVIHQELALVPDLSVAENIFLKNLHARRSPFIHYRALRQSAARLLERLGFDIDPATVVGRLPLAHQQVVEIAKALSDKPRILIFDEPTAVLANRDAERLLDIIRELRAGGTGIVYISHRLSEVFALADRITVLKDGAHVKTVKTSETSLDAVIAMMVGQPVSSLFPAKAGRKTGDVVLKVNKISRGRKVRGVSLTLRAGEIVGLGGLVGSGRSELARLIFAADKASSGHIELKGKKVAFSSPRAAVKAHIGLVPEDRKSEGVILSASVRSNMTLARLKDMTWLGFIKRRKEKRITQELAGSMRLKAAGVDVPVASLSGGNQQKVVLAKWFYADCDVLIFDEPTRGVDVGAKSEIYTLIDTLARLGKAVLVISSEHQELFGLCDRILVMAEGRMRGELAPQDFSEQKLLTLAMTQITTDPAIKLATEQVDFVPELQK